MLHCNDVTDLCLFRYCKHINTFSCRIVCLSFELTHGSCFKLIFFLLAKGTITLSYKNP